MQKPSPEIINGCLKNDRRAQHRLYQLSYSVLMSVCRRYRKDDQDAAANLNVGFLKILTNLSKYDPKISFEAWIRRIMINTLIDDFRKNKKRLQTIELKDFSSPVQMVTDNQWNEAELQLEADHLLLFIDKLPPMGKQVFNLFAIDGFSHKEIGELLNISDGTSKWHVNDARKRLATMIKGHIKSHKKISHGKQA